MILKINKKDVFFVDTGIPFDKKKHSIVLLHGSGQSHVVWSLVTQFLSDKNFNVITLDLPGHGNSEGESLDSIEDTVEWLKKVLNEIGIKDLTLVGHSQGCLISLEYSFKYPFDVKNLVFIAGSFEIPVNSKLISLAESGNLESLNLMMKWGYGNSKRFIGGNPLQKILNSPREVREVLAVDLKACNNYKNGKIAAEKIKCPTLLILGELDKMITLDQGKKFSSLVNNSKIHVIKNCGHMIILENAFELREKIVEFLND